MTTTGTNGNALAAQLDDLLRQARELKAERAELWQRLERLERRTEEEGQ